MPFPVQDLIEGRPIPVIVHPDDSVQMALDLMVEHDYSQLPVINIDDKPVGMVTSDSILRALRSFDVTTSALKVSDAIVRARLFHLDDDLFALLDDLVDSYAV